MRTVFPLLAVALVVAGSFEAKAQIVDAPREAEAIAVESPPSPDESSPSSKDAEARKPIQRGGEADDEGTTVDEDAAGMEPLRPLAPEDALAPEDPLAPEERRRPEPGVELPSTLPPLDPDLVSFFGADDDTFIFPDVRLLAHGRLRLEYDDGRVFRDFDESFLGASFTGRAGFEVPVGDHSARIVLGDGVRLGTPSPLIPVPLVFVEAGRFLYEVSLTLSVPLFGLPFEAKVGRMPIQVADGRWIGNTPFDPRGRTFDGAYVASSLDAFFIQGGAFAQSSTLGALVGEPLLWLLFAEGGWRTEFISLDTYAFAHRDVTTSTQVNAATVGGRGGFNVFGIEGSAGVDGQASAIDLAPFSPAAFAFHGEVQLRYGVDGLNLGFLGSPYIQGNVEATFGSTIDGKSFRAPGGDVHRFLGILDLLGPSNVATAGLEVGFRDDLVTFALGANVYASVDPSRPILDPLDRVVVVANPTNSRFFMTEVDARLALEFAEGAFLEGEAGIAFPGPGLENRSYPAQRALVSVRFDVDIGLAPSAPAAPELP